MFSLFDELPPLTDAQVAALAKPGESWEEARHRARRLQLCVTECEPCSRCNALRRLDSGRRHRLPRVRQG